MGFEIIGFSDGGGTKTGIEETTGSFWIETGGITEAGTTGSTFFGADGKTLAGVRIESTARYVGAGRDTFGRRESGVRDAGRGVNSVD